MASTAAVQSAGTGGSLLSMGKQRGLAMRSQETPPRASRLVPDTIAEHLLAAVHVEGSGDGSGEGTDSLLLPEHLIDTAMVAELVEHARKLLEERTQQGSECDVGSGGGGASAGSAAGGNGDDDEGGGERKDTASSSSREGIAPFELAVVGGAGDGTAKDSQATPAAVPVPWAVNLLGEPEFALRKRPGRVVKLVPVEEDTKGMERGEDGSIILRDETMLRDRIHACSSRLGKCIDVGQELGFALAAIVCLVAVPALPFAILKFTNSTDVLFGPHVANTSSAISAVNTSNTTTSDHNGPPWWVDECVCARETCV